MSKKKIKKAGRREGGSANTSLKRVASWIRRFVWSCGGAPLGDLEHPDCEADRINATITGTQVLITSALAALSGGYAASTIFPSPHAYLPMAALWGLTIFTLDRALLVSMRPSFGLERASASRRVVPLLLRLSVGVSLAFVIATPLELRIYRDEILEHLSEKEQADRQREKDSRDQKLQEESTRLSLERKQLAGDISTAETDYGKEATGLGATGVKGAGPVSTALRRAADNIASANKPRINQIDERLNQITRELNGANQPPAATEATGERPSPPLLTSIAALHELMDQNPTHRRIVWAITLLFIMVELIPVLTKMLRAGSACERLMRKREIEIDADYLISVAFRHRLVEEARRRLEPVVNLMLPVALRQAADTTSRGDTQMTASTHFHQGDGPFQPPGGGRTSRGHRGKGTGRKKIISIGLKTPPAGAVAEDWESVKEARRVLRDVLDSLRLPYSPGSIMRVPVNGQVEGLFTDIHLTYKGSTGVILIEPAEAEWRADRTNEIEEAFALNGVTVMRCTAAQCLRDPDRVVEQMLDLLDLRRAA